MPVAVELSTRFEPRRRAHNGALMSLATSALGSLSTSTVCS